MNVTTKILIASTATIIVAGFLFRKRLKKIVVATVDYGLEAEQESYVKELNPEVQEKFRQLIFEAQELGYRVWVTSGYRSSKAQEKLYKLNPSNAKPGRSYHNYGLALDLNLISSDGTWYKKSDSKEKWLQTGVPQMARMLGFTWGGDFKNYHDPVHFRYSKGQDINSLLALKEKQKVNENKIKLS